MYHPWTQRVFITAFNKLLMSSIFTNTRNAVFKAFYPSLLTENINFWENTEKVN